VIVIERVRPSDEPAIRSLLVEVELPTEDLTSGSFDRFIVARSEGAVVGVIGFEIYGTTAMARSLAVSPSFRKQGIASALLIEVERLAASNGARTMHGLTMTIEAFLSVRGYERVERGDAPDEIQRTSEFTVLCPESAVLMRKRLN